VVGPPFWSAGGGGGVRGRVVGEGEWGGGLGLWDEREIFVSWWFGEVRVRFGDGGGGGGCAWGGAGGLGGWGGVGQMTAKAAY